MIPFLSNLFRGPLRALQFRNYRLFFLGQMVGLNGTWMTMAAMGWLLHRLTGDPFMLGLMAFYLQGPTFFLAPLGGVTVDHFSRRGIIVLAQALDSLAIGLLAFLTLTGQVEVWHILTACGILGVVKAFEMPARQALVADLVEDPALLGNAIALNSSIFHGARLVGPLLAGAVLIPLGGEGLCFLVHTICYLLAIRCFLALRPRPRSGPGGGQSILGEIRGGFRYAFARGPVRDLILLSSVFALLGMPYNTLLPVFAAEILRGDSGTFGSLLAAGGFGAVVAAFLLASRRSIAGTNRIIASSTILFGISLMGFAWSNYFFLSLAFLMVVGFAQINVMVGANTIIQSTVNDEYRGRVMSILGMVFMGSLPMGSLVFGKAATLLGAPSTVGIGALTCLVIGLLSRKHVATLRERRSLEQSV